MVAPTSGATKGRRSKPVAERKVRLRSVIPKCDERLLYCDHVEQDSEGLFRLVRENDLEGIVAKRKFDSYLPEQGWLNRGREGGVVAKREATVAIAANRSCSTSSAQRGSELRQSDLEVCPEVGARHFRSGK